MLSQFDTFSLFYHLWHLSVSPAFRLACCRMQHLYVGDVCECVRACVYMHVLSRHAQAHPHLHVCTDICRYSLKGPTDRWWDKVTCLVLDRSSCRHSDVAPKRWTSRKICSITRTYKVLSWVQSLLKNAFTSVAKGWSYANGSSRSSSKNCAYTLKWA